MKLMSLLATTLLVLGCGQTVKDSDTGTTGGSTTAGETTGATTGETTGETGNATASACGDTVPQDGTSLGENGVIKDLTLKNCAGEEQRLSDRVCTKKLTAIAFGAGWCEPCREEQPVLQELYEKCGDAGLGVLTILGEQNGPGDPATSAFCEAWTTEYKLTFPVWTDPLAKYWKDATGGDTLPANYLVDDKMNIIYKCLGNDCADFAEVVKDTLPACK